MTKEQLIAAIRRILQTLDENKIKKVYIFALRLAK